MQQKLFFGNTLPRPARIQEVSPIGLAYVPGFILKDPLLDELTICYRRLNRPPVGQEIIITCSADAYRYFKKVWPSDFDLRERALILVMNRRNEVLGWGKVSSGGQAGTVMDPKIIFQFCLRANAASFMMAHNHPSGALKPSSSDTLLTKKLKQSGEVMEMPILDHLILTHGGYYSFADEGII